MRKLSTILFLIFSLPALSFAQAPLIRHFEWQGPFGEALSVEAINYHGDVRARRGASGFAPVSAVIQKHPEDAVDPEIKIVSQGILRVEVIYPEDSPPTPANPDILSFRRVDVTIYVPPGAPYVCRTLKGLIEAKGLQSDVDVRSKTGKIVVRTAGAIKAVSETGKIIGWLKNPEAAGRSYFETKTGDIRIFVSPRADLSVSIDTGGFITSDFSMEVRPTGRIREKHAVATIGKGAGKMIVKSVVGDIQLIRIIE